MLNLQELAGLTDEQCNSADISGGLEIPTRELRDLAKNYMLIESGYEFLRKVFLKGLTVGYIIKCPKCGVTYDVSPSELNFDKPIKCQDCGEEYVQNRNIHAHKVNVYTQV